VLSGSYNTKNVLIYGAGENLELLTQSALTNNTKSRVKVIGYVDKDSQK